MRSVSVRVENKLNVVAYIVHSGEIVAKANRTSVHNDWFVGLQIDGAMRVVATVSHDLPEVLQRKMILAIMSTLPAKVSFLGGQLNG